MAHQNIWRAKWHGNSIRGSQEIFTPTMYTGINRISREAFTKKANITIFRYNIIYGRNQG